MGLESQSAINPRHKSRPIKADQPSIAWAKLGMSHVRISPNLLNQPIKCFFDLLGSCSGNRPKWNMQWILECMLILITY